jgi:hypothetical protein
MTELTFTFNALNSLGKEVVVNVDAEDVDQAWELFEEKYPKLVWSARLNTPNTSWL